MVIPPDDVVSLTNEDLNLTRRTEYGQNFFDL